MGDVGGMSAWVACYRACVGSVLVWVVCEPGLRGWRPSVGDMATRVAFLVCQRV